MFLRHFWGALTSCIVIYNLLSLRYMMWQQYILESMLQLRYTCIVYVHYILTGSVDSGIFTMMINTITTSKQTRTSQCSKSFFCLFLKGAFRAFLTMICVLLLMGLRCTHSQNIQKCNLLSHIDFLNLLSGTFTFTWTSLTHGMANLANGVVWAQNIEQIL